ncbi:hypothetical protein I350_03252 [Cryptococcus amylolentus CBS 6273]|uniref:Uncharacterized protein n=1 Tax=Cryptococcus amylolentus CBS 6273 TaxID=1296118 RepID=A0A1E3K3Q3_9TREE|nr:hypothetical protein I350_03252 [Cryptococcus amylolentus CBS 6273]
MSDHDENTPNVRDDVSMVDVTETAVITRTPGWGNTLSSLATPEEPQASNAEIDRWIEVAAASADADDLESQLPNPLTQRQLSYLRADPALGSIWMQQASAYNRKVLSQYQQTRPELNVSNITSVEFFFHNDRSRLASWAIVKGSANIDVTEDVYMSAALNSGEYQESLEALAKEGLWVHERPPPYAAHALRIRSLLISRDLNETAVRQINEGGFTELPSDQLNETRLFNANTTKRFEYEGWPADFGQDFEELVNSWAESLNALRDAGITDKEEEEL